MKRLILCCCVLMLLCPRLVLCQVTPAARIIGKIVDASTGEGLPNVNVFLAGTTLGTASAPDGAFSIARVPRGTYELIVSMVGYERQSVPLQIFEAKEYVSNVRLKPTAILTATVEVTAKDPVEWKEDFERFRKEFLGETQNAQLCTILNPETMEFKKTGGVFEVAFHVPIVVENRALGYKLDLVIEEFRTDGSTLQYSAKTKFEELKPAQDEEYHLWVKNRKQAYNGSRRHFLAALGRGKSYEEGFTIRIVPTLRLSTGFRRSAQVVDYKQLVLPTQYEFQKRLTFKDYLEVTYRVEPAEPAFRLAVNAQGQPLEQQVSWLQMTRLTVAFDLSGNLQDPFSLKSVGYWAFERVADQLPTDYVPE